MLVAAIALVCVRAGEPAASAAPATAGATVATRLASKIRADAPSVQSASADSSLSSDISAAEAAMDEMLIALVNAQEGGSWTAGVNDYFQGKTKAFLKQSCGLKLTAQQVREHEHQTHRAATMREHSNRGFESIRIHSTRTKSLLTIRIRMLCCVLCARVCAVRIGCFSVVHRDEPDPGPDPLQPR